MRVPFIILIVYFKYVLIEANSIRENITKDYEFEGDIILYDEEDFSYQILGDAVGSQSRLWKKEDNEVQIPYIVPLDTPVFHRRQIQRAIDEFSLKTCIKFIPRNEEPDYVLIDTINWPNYCHSAMGRLGGEQIVRAGNCKENDILHWGRICHELMHVAGFLHEQNRNDADDYIEIDYDAIKQVEMEDFLRSGSLLKQFRKCNETKIGKRWGCRRINNYDGDSILHYPSVAGHVNPKTVFTSKRKCHNNRDCEYGQRKGLSPGDVEDIATLYNCSTKFDQYDQCTNLWQAEKSILCKHVNCNNSEAQELCREYCGWNQWTEWYGDCCYGFQFRSRSCKDSKITPCSGKSVEKRKCRSKVSCVEWNDWGEFGLCFNGVQARSRTCKQHQGPITCNNEIETASCSVPSNIQNYTNISLWSKIGEYTIIPFTIPRSVSSQDKSDIAQAIIEISSKTCVRFKHYNYRTDSNYIYIDTTSANCSSKIGMLGGRQRIRAGGCRRQSMGNTWGKLCQQLVHTLGFIHENNREDRDSYIDVDLNIIPQYILDYSLPKNKEKTIANAYNIQSSYPKTGTPYDCLSITHFKPYLQSKKYTNIFPKPSLKECGNMGKNMKLSDIDIMDINILYGCGSYLDV